jgi:hypothetical protein
VRDGPHTNEMVERLNLTVLYGCGLVLAENKSPMIMSAEIAFERLFIKNMTASKAKDAKSLNEILHGRD